MTNVQNSDEERLLFALEKHQYPFLKFIKQPLVPFDNNRAEMDLRMIRVKQKVYGCLRSDAHARNGNGERGIADPGLRTRGTPCPLKNLKIAATVAYRHIRTRLI